MRYGERTNIPTPKVFGPVKTLREAKTAARSVSGFEEDGPRSMFDAPRSLVEIGTQPIIYGPTVFNVKDYGARGDGVAIENEAINAAIDAAVLLGGGTVYFPAGTYLLNDTVHLQPAVNLRGEGMDCTIVKMTVAGVMFDNINVTAVAMRTTYSDFMLNGNSVGTVALDFTRSNYVHLHRLSFRGFTAGGNINARFTECFWPHIFGCYFESSGGTLLLLDKATHGCNQSTVHNNEFLAGVGANGVVANGQNLQFRDNDFEGGSGGDIGLDLRHVEGVLVEGNYFELWDDKAITLENGNTEVQRIVVRNNVINAKGSLIVQLNCAAVAPTDIEIAYNRFSDNSALQTCINIGNATRVRYFGNDSDLAKLTAAYAAGVVGPMASSVMAGTLDRLPKRNSRDEFDDSGVSDDGNTIGILRTLAPAAAITPTGAIAPANITVSQNDYEPTGFLTANFVRITANAGLSITGWGRDGARHMKVLVNGGTNAITLTHESGSSTANKRMNLPGAVNFTLSAGMCVWLIYDTTSDRWRVLG